MSVRDVMVGTFAVVVLLLLGFVEWQTAVNKSDTAVNKSDIGKLAESINKFLDEDGKGWATKKNVNELGGKVGAIEKDLNDNLAAHRELSVSVGYLVKDVQQDIPAKLARLNANLEAANARLAKAEASAVLTDSFDKRLAKVEGDLDANIKVTLQQSNELGRVVKKDNVGNSILSIGTQMQNSQFKDEFGKAVREVISPPIPTSQVQPLWGTVRIDNRMASWQYLEVNGVGHWVGPLSYLDVVVPAGFATTRLANYEGTKRWWLGAPDFFQMVTIEPQPLYSAVVGYP